MDKDKEVKGQEGNGGDRDGVKQVSRETITETENGDKVVRDERGRLLPGSVLTRNGGRKKGSRDFMTDFQEAIKGIRDKSTGEPLTMEMIVRKGLERMITGNGAKFENLYMDLLDRVYGKPKQTTEIVADVFVADTETKERLDTLIAELIDDNQRHTPRK